MTPQDQSRQTKALCQLAPVIPVIVIKDVAHAEGLARALVAGGLPVLEVTLRSDAALDAIRAMSGVAGGHVGGFAQAQPFRREPHAQISPSYQARAMWLSCSRTRSFLTRPPSFSPPARTVPAI